MRETPFDGYHRRDVPLPDPELTRVGPGTPCGEYLRRFWQPVAFVRELAATPMRVQILGEDLVVFRDHGGRFGALHLHCAHRGTSLEFGIPVERGIRCCYHFTEGFGVVPEIDWHLTEAGMVYLATRRVGDLVWVRVADFMPPNVHQFTREIEKAAEAKAASRPVIVRWAVPNDDIHTTNFELAQVDPAWGLTAEQVGQPGFRSFRGRSPRGPRRATRSPDPRAATGSAGSSVRAPWRS